MRAVISAASSASTMPSLSVVQAVPSRRRNDAPALSSPPKPSDPSSKAVDEPLETDRHLVERAAEPSRSPDRSSRCSRRSFRRRRPGASGGDAGRDRRSPPRGSDSAAAGRRSGDDAVPIVIRVARERDVEPVLEADQPLHRVGRRGVHPDLAVPIDRHETERRIDHVVDDGEVETVTLRDRRPVVNARAAERIDAQRMFAPRIASMSMTLARSAT